MKTIYKSENGKLEVLSLYDRQLKRLPISYKDIYIDTIGHPGKSAEVSLSPYNYNYGKWASEVVSALGYEKIACFGGSYGAGVLAKLMCVSPEKVAKALLYVPSGIKNAPAINGN